MFTEHKVERFPLSILVAFHPNSASQETNMPR